MNTKEQIKCDTSYEYLKLGHMFLNLAIASSQELVTNENRRWVTHTQPISNEYYEEKTKWSDFNISIPVLFNFYHGIELVLKGLIISKSEPTKQHKLTSLLSEFNTLYGETETSKLINSAITNFGKEKNLINEFLDLNNENIDKWYEFLKYPYDTKNNRYCHDIFINNDKSALDFWQEIINISKGIINSSFHFYKENIETEQDKANMEYFIEKFNNPNKGKP